MNKKILVFFLAVCLPPLAQSFTVNRLNGGGTVIYIDFNVTTGGPPLQLIRSYNSITALSESSGWDGAFGWGWTSPFETTLSATAERQVILRDGATGNTVVFQQKKEDPVEKKKFYEKLKRAYFEKQKGRKLSDKELANVSIPSSLNAKIQTDTKYRTDFANAYGLKAAVPRDELLVSSEFGYETLRFSKNQWVREKGPLTQTFDKEGRLIRQVDKNGYTFDYTYDPKQPLQLQSILSKDKSASLKFKWSGNRIFEIVDNNGKKAAYSFDKNGNLAKVTDSSNQTYQYRYDTKGFPHLLSAIEYSGEKDPTLGSFREIQYDKNGLVVFHKDRDKTEIVYAYGKGSSEPENNFWTKTTKKFPNGKSEEQYDEFFLKARGDGGKYLFKQTNKTNGLETTTLYTACCGKPQQVTTNGKVTNFKYSPEGLLIEKSGPKEEVKIEYDPRWKKVAKVVQNDLTAIYKYDNKGNLVEASNSNKQRVSLSYDKLDRVATMVDSQKRTLAFKYGSNGKPSEISQKGVGIIHIYYDTKGQVTKTESAISDGDERKPSTAKSQEIIQRVMKSFQNLLDILRPAGAGFTV